MLGSHNIVEVHHVCERPHGTMSLPVSERGNMSSFPHLWNEVHKLLQSTEQLL